MHRYLAWIVAVGVLTAAAPRPLAAQAGAPLVVIDAGHGGVDPGARGPAGTLEKNVALALARMVADRLEEGGRVEVRLTRDSDVLIPLAERTRLANDWRRQSGADRPALFLSIHLNAHDSRGVRGFETYFLSEAHSEDARRVAAFENAAQRYEEAKPSADPLGFILNDLRQNHYLRESSDGASLFQKRLARVNPGPDRGVKQAGFVVLDGAFMPAVLVEVGFITNPAEEGMLRSPDHQQRIADQLADSILEFFSRPSVSGVASNR